MGDREISPVLEVSTTRAVRRAFREAPRLRSGLGLTVGLALLGTTVTLVVPVIVQQIMDHDILGAEGVDVTGAVTKAGLGLVALVVGAVANRTSTLRLLSASAHGLSDLRVACFARLHRMSILHIESERRGSLVSRVTADISTIQDFMDWGGVGLLVGGSQIILALGVMVVYDWRLALLVAGGVSLFAVLLLWFQRILQKAHDRVRVKVADSMSAMGEAISGMPVVRAYGAEGPTMARVGSTLDAQFAEEYRTGALGAVLFSSAELFAGLLTAAVVAVGVVLGAGTGVSAGTLLAFLFLVNLLVDPVQVLVEILDTAQRAGAGLRRILAVLDGAIEIQDPIRPVSLPDGGLPVAFESVGFTYPSGEPALRGVSVAIPAGTRVAVVGETGSGKTTFAKVATRLLEVGEGVVSIGGIDVRDVALADLRRRVSFVPQEGFLFDATIAENVRYGDLAATDHQLEVAFADLGLGDWLDQMPDGIDTEVGERGSRLSAGERQLVALVRAWIAGPDLLVLDEATSAVDPVLDVRLRTAMERLTRGRTSITIAHRLSTAESAELVLVFDGGRLVESGPHGHLVAANGVYAALHRDWAASTST